LTDIPNCCAVTNGFTVEVLDVDLTILSGRRDAIESNDGCPIVSRNSVSIVRSGGEAIFSSDGGPAIPHMARPVVTDLKDMATAG
ncbi:hypothetical protein, partial [Pseudomonas aeruginosa]|uniref:hypothetical protein n=1 Tax=Pseudomonas aeruginosa TaxID=287 RepID=UPI000A942A28